MWSNAFLVEWSNWWYILPTQQKNVTSTTFYKVMALHNCEKVGKKKISQEKQKLKLFILIKTKLFGLSKF